MLRCSWIYFTCSRIPKPRTSPFQPLIDTRFIYYYNYWEHFALLSSNPSENDTFGSPPRLPLRELKLHLTLIALCFDSLKKRKIVSGHYTHLKGLAIAQGAVCILEVEARIRNGLTSFRSPLGSVLWFMRKPSMIVKEREAPVSLK